MNVTVLLCKRRRVPTVFPCFGRQCRANGPSLGTGSEDCGMVCAPLCRGGPTNGAESAAAGRSSTDGALPLFLFFSFSPPQFSCLGILTLKERSENVTQGCANADTGRNRCFSIGGFPLKPCRCFQLSLVCFRHAVSLDQQTEVPIRVHGSSVLLSLRVYVRVLLWFCSGRGTATAFIIQCYFFKI